METSGFQTIHSTHNLLLGAMDTIDRRQYAVVVPSIYTRCAGSAQSSDCSRCNINVKLIFETTINRNVTDVVLELLRTCSSEQLLPVEVPSWYRMCKLITTTTSNYHPWPSYMRLKTKNRSSGWQHEKQSTFASRN